MIDWLFRKKKAPPQADAARAERAVTVPPRTTPAPAAPATVDWEAALAAARGDDDALLALACGGAPVDTRLAAVGALASEDALKRAERALRKDDRRVHRLAKQRHAGLLAQRDTRLRATELTAAARTMLEDPLIAANRLVELDRAWQALDQALLEGMQAAEFGALFARLAALARERADRALDFERWDAAAQEALGGLRSACAQAAAGAIDRAALAANGAQAQSILDAAASDTQEGSDRRATLRDALQAAAELTSRLEVLDALQQAAARAATGPSPVPPASAAAQADALAPAGAGARDAPSTAVANDATSDAGVHDASSTAIADARQRWRALAPLADAGLAQTLEARFMQVQRALQPARPARRAEQPKVAERHDAGARLALIAQHVEQAEAALAEGHLAEAGSALAAIDAQARAGVPPAALRARIERLHAEAARLRGWQQWGGARARDELVAQAKALAAAGADAPDPALARLSTRQRADLIGELRARWKELDRHGGVSNRALWQRFDAALTIAYAPVAAQAEAQRAARAHNLQARIELLAALEAVPLPGGDPLEGGGRAGRGHVSDEASGHPPESAAASASSSTSADASASDSENASATGPSSGSASTASSPPASAPDSARRAAGAQAPAAGTQGRPGAAALAAALAEFHSAWRRLGPLEHTVPRAEREPLQNRMEAAVARLDAPLREARSAAQAQREQLIARARALVAANAAPPRDGLPKVRALQAEWQQAAQALPLARAVEAALWSDFKGAIDALYAARHADSVARDAAFKAQLDARRALIARLEGATDLSAGDAAQALERALAEVDAQWRQAGAAPRAHAAPLEARYRAARDAARARLTDAARRRWQAQCDALAARLAEHDGVPADAPVSIAEPARPGEPAKPSQPVESATPAQPETPATPAAAQAALPPQWERALVRRAVAPQADAMSNDELLLRLEAGLGIESPPAFADARRALKLQAMKAALEGRPAGATAPRAAGELLAEALARDAFDAAQRARLRAVVGRLRDTAPLSVD